jgi:hypothetical protein
MLQTRVLHEANGIVRGSVIVRKVVLMHKVYHQVLSPKPLYNNQNSTQQYLWAAIEQQCLHSLQFEMVLVATQRRKQDYLAYRWFYWWYRVGPRRHLHLVCIDYISHYLPTCH